MRKFMIVLISLTSVAALAAVAAVQAGARAEVGACVDALPGGGLSAYRTQADDGNCLQGYVWAPAPGTPVRAAVVIAHGLGDHARRYGTFAQALNARGVAVLAQDQRGHAGSGGTRQRIDSLDQAAGDAERALQEAAKRWPDVPRILHGHSFGGLVATHVATTTTHRLAGVVVSSAALQRPAGVSGVQVGIVSTVSALLPDLGLEALDVTRVVREPAAQAELTADPLVSREKLPARTVATLLKGIDAIQPRLSQMSLPLLVLHGGADTITPPAGSRVLHERAASTEKSLYVYDAARHDLLHEPEAGAVTQRILDFVLRERR
ncbi:MAG: alpha/beta hydrolase [Burkholderiaceae bacterium]